MITIVETRLFADKAEKLLSVAEKDELINFLAANPEAGDVIPGTGGVRKLRFAAEGRGKRAGVRVIYYYYNVRNPILLFTYLVKMRNRTSHKKNETRYTTLFRQ